MNKIVLHALSILIFSVTHAQGVWTQKADYGGLPRAFGAGFSIGDMGYIGSGANQKDFWEWNSLTDTWTQIADFGGVLRRDATGFSVGNKGYIGTGTSGGWPNYFYYNDLWEWDQSTNSWSKMSDLPAKGRFSSFGFTISNKGYIGTGKDSLGYLLNDFWEFDPANDVWMQKADFGGGGRFFAIGFGVAGKGFAGLGYNGFSKMKDFWMYDTLTNTWAKITDFPGGERTQAVAFSIEDTGYVGLGWNESTPTIFYKNFWKLNTQSLVWSSIPDFPGLNRVSSVGFSINNKGYVGIGTDSTYAKATDHFWEYDPNGITAVPAKNNKNIFCIYPNPVKDIIRIKNTFIETYRENELQVTFINLQGNEIKSSKLHTSSYIYVGDLPAGAYYVAIRLLDDPSITIQVYKIVVIR